MFYSYFFLKNYVYHTFPPPCGAGLDSRLLGHEVFVRRAQEHSYTLMGKILLDAVERLTPLPFASKIIHKCLRGRCMTIAIFADFFCNNGNHHTHRNSQTNID